MQTQKSFNVSVLLLKDHVGITNVPLLLDAIMEYNENGARTE